MVTVSSNQAAAISAVVKASQDGVKRALNPADPTDAAAINAFLELSGKTPDSHPGLYFDLGNVASGANAAASDEPHALDIVDQGRDAQGRATARVWHLDQEGVYVASSLALVLHGETGQPLALGYANKVGGGLCPAATRSATALPAPDKITTVGFYHSQSHPEAVPAFGMVAKTTQLTADNMPNVSVNDPVSHTHSSVRIALGRPAPGTDADYTYSQDTNDNPILLVPFTGTVDVQAPLGNVDGNGHFTSGLILNTRLYWVSGVTYINGGTPNALLVTANTQTNVVTWNYAYNATQSLTYDPTAGVNNPVNWSPDNQTAFFFEFQIPLATPIPPTYSFNVCSTDWPDQPSVYCKQIQPLEFWWHCLAEGTLVTLADGSTREIEKVDNTVRVRTGQGTGELGVEATTRGQHRVVQPNAPRSAVYKLTTAKGRDLVLTGGHPVATPSGLVVASDLTVGAEVLAEDGVDTVAKLEVEASDGVFANLKLVDETDRARGLGGAVGTFIANGVVVGDYLALRQSHYVNVHSLDYMRPRIPERHHADYANTLNTIHQDNQRYGGAF